MREDESVTLTSFNSAHTTRAEHRLLLVSVEHSTSLFWPYYPIIHNLCGRQIFIIPLKCHGNIHKVWRRHKRPVISVANVSYYKLKHCLAWTTNLNIHELVQHLLKQQLFCFVKICSLHTLFFQQNIEKMLEGKPTQKVFTIFNILEIIWFEPKCATFEPFCAVTLITFWKLISVICQLTGPAGLWLGCGWAGAGRYYFRVKSVATSPPGPGRPPAAAPGTLSWSSPGRGWIGIGNK